MVATTQRPMGAVAVGTFHALFSQSHDAVIRVYDAAGNLIETHEHAGDFKSFESPPQFPSSAHTASDETGSHWGVTTCKIRKIYA
jgi:hypothetical protein